MVMISCFQTVVSGEPQIMASNLLKSNFAVLVKSLYADDLRLCTVCEARVIKLHALQWESAAVSGFLCRCFTLWELNLMNAGLIEAEVHMMQLWLF